MPEHENVHGPKYDHRPPSRVILNQQTITHLCALRLDGMARAFEEELGQPLAHGRTWLACALGNAACRQGFSALYARLPRLLEELRIAHGDGSFGRRLVQLARIDVLILDDWAVAPITAPARHDLLEVLDDRTGTRATIITSQLPLEKWYEYLAEPTIADAILDHIVHHSHRIALEGESLRNEQASRK